MQKKILNKGTIMKYRVRFHLQSGQHYMHWQIRSKDGFVAYFDPDKYQIEMTNCKLVNKINTAIRVNEEGVKDVCGWVECDSFNICNNIPVDYLERVSYNPIKDVHWRRSGDDGQFSWDNSRYDSLVTNGPRVYVLEESLV